MNIALTAIEEANLVAFARIRGTTPESVLREAMGPILQGSPEGPEDAAAPRVPRRHIARVIADRMNKLPGDVFEELPVDGASEHDHCIHGAPKRNG